MNFSKTYQQCHYWLYNIAFFITNTTSSDRSFHHAYAWWWSGGAVCFTELCSLPHTKYQPAFGRFSISFCILYASSRAVNGSMKESCKTTPNGKNSIKKYKECYNTGYVILKSKDKKLCPVCIHVLGKKIVKCICERNGEERQFIITWAGGMQTYTKIKKGGRSKKATFSHHEGNGPNTMNKCNFNKIK